jgi:arabinogalactan oligomer / maltooligosaccharide transport system permease protein
MTMHKKKLTLGTVLVYAMLTAIAISVILPIFWIVISSLQPGNNLYSSSFIPKGLTIEHYIKLFTETDYLIWYKNTLLIAFLNMFFGLLITTITAYVFSRYHFKGKKITMISILILQMFPSMLAMTAIYIILVRLGLVDTFTGLLLIYVAGGIPFNAWIAKGYFDAIPRTLDEAARVDGAGHLTIFVKIIMPITKPILVFIAVTNFTAPWFDFVFPSLLLTDPKKYTLAMGIFNWVQTRANTNFTMFAAGAILVAIPITVLFAVLQKHIVSGLSQGAVKG